MPKLRHDFTGGIPGLFSDAGFDIAWTQYQHLMIEKLNVLTSGWYPPNCHGKGDRGAVLPLPGSQEAFHGPSANPNFRNRIRE